MSTVVDVPAGMFRAALGAVLPHAGKATDDTPDLGRVRLHLTATHLLVWATDRLTAGLARVEVGEFVTGELDGCDLPADSVRKVLAVFTPPSNPDARSMWLDDPLRVEVTDKHVRVTEVGRMVQGESLTVDRVIPAGEDRYPDVPRLLVEAIAGQDPLVPARPDMGAASRFATAAKAYAAIGSRPVVYLLPGADVVLARIGRAFIGTCPNHAEARDAVTLLTNAWADELAPLRRPVPVTVPDDVVDGLRDQAERLFREHGTTVEFTVVRGGDES